MNKASLYNKLVYETLAFYITEQLQFQIQIVNTKELKSYLPEEAFTKDGLIIDFREWILEEALVFDTTLECIVVYGDTEYPISIDLVDIDSIIDTTDYHLVMKKTLDTDNQKVEVFESYDVKEKISKMEERARKFQKKNQKGIEFSLSKLTLLKPEPEEPSVP